MLAYPNYRSGPPTRLGSVAVTTVEDWRAQQRAHESRVEALVSEHEARRSRGASHPVWDFLFTYYVYRPNQLRRWHPGLGSAVGDAQAPHRSWTFYRWDGEAAVVDVEELYQRRSALITFVRRLMRSTLERTAHLSCFGMHEWAMVYRLREDEIRHESWPLRLAPSRIEDVVEQRGLRCTHFDAYRFFTAPALPLNRTALDRDGQLAHEQPGCLHAGMDLYKWAYKLSPATPSELVLDAFELARDIRLVDMQASPYDLAELGIEPIRVETPEGRSRYAALQSGFAERARPIRARLLEVCEQLTTQPAL